MDTKPDAVAKSIARHIREGRAFPISFVRAGDQTLVSVDGGHVEPSTAAFDADVESAVAPPR